MKGKRDRERRKKKKRIKDNGLKLENCNGKYQLKDPRNSKQDKYKPQSNPV